MPGTTAAPEGITNPPIDDLLTTVDSKYSLVIYAAKRARQINAYYSQLGEGLLEYVGPLVETHVQEKPLSVALREIDAGLLTCEKVPPARPRPRAWRRAPSAAWSPSRCPALSPPAVDDDAPGTSSSASPAASRPTRPRPCCGCCATAGTTSPSCPPRPRCASSASRPGRRCPATRSPPTSGATPTRCRTCASAGPPTWSSSRRPPPTCSRGPPTAWPTTCSTSALLTAPCPVAAGPGHAHRDVGAPGHPRQRGHAARAGRRRARPRRRPAHRRRLRAGPAARARATCCTRACRGACWSGRPRSAAGSDLAGRRRRASPPAAPASRSTRCGSSATRSSGRQGSPWPPRRRVPGARRVHLVAAGVDLPDPAGVRAHRPGRDRTRAARGRAGRGARRRWRRRRRDGRRGRRLPARTRSSTKIKKSGDDDGAPRSAGAHRRRARRRSHAGRPGGRAGRRRLRRRDRGRRRRRARPRRRKLARKGLRPARGQRRVRRRGVRQRAQQGRPASAPTARCARWSAGDRKLAVAARGLGRPSSTRSARRLGGLVGIAPLRVCGPVLARRAAAPPADAAVENRDPRRAAPVHVRVRHRGAPGQDLRPDQRRDPRRHARAGPRAAASRWRPWSPPAWSTSPAR